MPYLEELNRHGLRGGRKTNISESQILPCKFPLKEAYKGHVPSWFMPPLPNAGPDADREILATDEAHTRDKFAEHAFQVLRSRYLSHYGIVPIEIHYRDHLYEFPRKSNGVLICEGLLKSGLRFPLSRFICRALNHYTIAPCQLLGNSYQLSFLEDLSVKRKVSIEVEDIRAFFQLRRIGSRSHSFNFYKRIGNPHLCTLPNKDLYRRSKVYEFVSANLCEDCVLVHHAVNDAVDTIEVNNTDKWIEAFELEEWTHKLPCEKRSDLPEHHDLFPYSEVVTELNPELKGKKPMRKGDDSTSGKRRLSSKVAPFKRLRRVSFINAVPKSASGKILRRELIEKVRAKM